MVDAGYFAKMIEPTPDWLHCQSVREICSVSTCVSSGAEDWVDHWRHNELGWFNPSRRRGPSFRQPSALDTGCSPTVWGSHGSGKGSP